MAAHSSKKLRARTATTRAGRRKPSRDDGAARPAGGWRRAATTLAVLLATLAILWAAAHAIVRTAGFREIVRERLAGRLGVPVRIGNLALDRHGRLHARDVRLGPTNQAGGLVADRLQFAWAGQDQRNLEIDGATLTLQRNAAGEWEPRQAAPLAMALARWGRFAPEVEPPAAAPDKTPADKTRLATTNAAAATADQPPDAWRSMGLALTHGTIRWLDAAGTPLAVAAGLRVQYTPLVVPGRHIAHCLVQADEITMPHDRRLTNLVLELLSTGDRHMLLGFQVQGQPGPAKGPGTLPAAP